MKDLLVFAALSLGDTPSLSQEDQMEAASVFIKTPDGRTEVRSREHRLSPRERATLIMIDGQRCLAELRNLSPVPDEVERHLQIFLDTGLISPLLPSPLSNTGSEPAVPDSIAIKTGAPADVAAPALQAPVLHGDNSELDHARLYILAVAQDTLGADAEEFSRRLTHSTNTQELLALAHHLREVLNRFVNAKEADQFWETVREIAPKA